MVRCSGLGLTCSAGAVAPRKAGEFFGATSEGLAKAIRKVFTDLGEPNAYITGEEMSGAFFVGLRKEPPRFGRWTYFEKFDYWAVFWGMFIMGGSYYVEAQ